MPRPGSAMTIHTYPGNLRIGVLDANKSTVVDRAAQPLNPKFKVLVLLNGYHKFAVNEREVELDATDHPAAMFFHLRARGTLRHLASSGHPYRKLALTTDLDWFNSFSESTLPQDSPLPFSHDDGDLSLQQWQPSKDLIRLSTQIILPPPNGDPWQTSLYRMSAGLEILRRVLEEVGQDNSRPGDAIAEQIRLFLLSQLENQNPLEALEAHMNLNRRSLQRHFKRRFGVTIADFLREARLQRAHKALSEDGVSIAMAAFMAGYTSPPNFATAFRRAYGVSPKLIQRVPR